MRGGGEVATTTSGTFNDDTHDIDSSGDGQTQHLGGDTSTTADCAFSSVTYHDSGTLSGDGSGAPALNGGFHYKSLTINTHDKGDAGGVAGINTGSLSNADDESDIVNDQSDGGETSAGGVLTQTGQEIHDDKTVDDENNEEAYTYGTSGNGGGHDAGGYVTVNDHAHDTGGFTEVGGAITEQDTSYTDDDIDTSGSHDDDTNHAPLAGGAETTTAGTYVVTQSSSFHDGGTYDQSPGNPTTDNGNSNDTVHNTKNAANDYNDDYGTGSLTQDNANGEIDDYYTTSGYSISDGVDTEHDTFNDKVQQTDSAENIEGSSAAGTGGGASYNDTSQFTSATDSTDVGSLDEANGVTLDETDNFTDDDTSDNTETYAGNGKGALVTPPVQDWNNLPQIAQGDYIWNAQGTVDDGNYSPVGGPAAASSLSSTANSTTDASTSHHDFGTYTLSPLPPGEGQGEGGSSSLVSTTSDTFNDTDTWTRVASQWISGSGNYSTSSAGTTADDQGNGTTTNGVDDHETLTDGGTYGGGVTTEHYTDIGKDDVTANSNGTWNTSSNTTATGTSSEANGAYTNSEEDKTGFTNSGHFTTTPQTSGSGGGGGGSIGSQSGMAGGEETFDYDDDVTQTQTAWAQGDETTPTLYVSGSGSFSTSASQSVYSTDTESTDGTTNSDNGSYDDSSAHDNDWTYQEHGTNVQPNMTSESFNFSASDDGKDGDDDSGSYTAPSGTDTTTSSDKSSEDATEIESTWTSGSGSGGGGWSPPGTVVNIHASYSTPKSSGGGSGGGSGSGSGGEAPQDAPQQSSGSGSGSGGKSADGAGVVTTTGAAPTPTKPQAGNQAGGQTPAPLSPRSIFTNKVGEWHSSRPNFNASLFQDGGVGAARVANIEAALQSNKNMSALLDILKVNGIKIRIVQSLPKPVVGGEAGGQYQRGTGVIDFPILITNPDGPPGSTKPNPLENLRHEIGHAIDQIIQTYNVGSGSAGLGYRDVYGKDLSLDSNGLSSLRRNAALAHYLPNSAISLDGTLARGPFSMDDAAAEAFAQALAVATRLSNEAPAHPFFDRDFANVIEFMKVKLLPYLIDPRTKAKFRPNS